MGILSMLFKIGVDSSSLELGLKRVQSLGEKFGNNFKSAVTSRLGQALSVAAITGFARSVVHAADAVGELADQLNISTDDVQKLQMASKLYGVQFEAVASAINRINDARTQAIANEGAQRAAFERLGFTVEKLSERTLGSEEVLVALGEKLNANRNDAVMMSAAVDLLGLKLVKAAMAAGTIKDLGPIDLFKAEDIKNIEKFNDQMDLLIKKTQVQSVAAAKSAYNIMDLAFSLFNLTQTGKALRAASLISSLPATVALDLASDKSRLLSKDSGETATKSGLTGKAGDRFIPPELMLSAIKGEKFALGGSQDPLARIGGFTGFQTAQDSLIKQAVEQTLQLKVISQNTKRTADTLVD